MFTSAIRWFNRIPSGVKIITALLLGFIIVENISSALSTQIKKAEVEDAGKITLAKDRLLNIRERLFEHVGIPLETIDTEILDDVISNHQKRTSTMIQAIAKYDSHWAHLSDSIDKDFKNDFADYERINYKPIQISKQITSTLMLYPKEFRDRPEFIKDHNETLIATNYLFKIKNVLVELFKIFDQMESKTIFSLMRAKTDIITIIFDVSTNPQEKFEYLKDFQEKFEYLKNFRLSVRSISAQMYDSTLEKAKTFEDEAEKKIIEEIVKNLNFFKEQFPTILKAYDEKAEELQKIFYQNHKVDLQLTVKIMEKHQLYDWVYRILYNYLGKKFQDFTFNVMQRANV